MLAELQRLYDLGYRGHVDFVDDNLIGNRKSLRIFLPELVAWQEAHATITICCSLCARRTSSPYSST
jgi:hypothetical protein